MVIPTRNCKRLTLRPLAEADALRLHGIMGQPDMLRYFPNPTPPKLDRVERLIQFQLDHWEQYDYGWWAIEVVEEEKQGYFVGWAGLQFLPETDEVEVAYMLDRDYWGQGLATEAAREALRYGFEQIKVKEIVGIVHPKNTLSIRVIEKLGMIFDARTPYFGMDCLRYALTAEKFMTRETATR